MLRSFRIAVIGLMMEVILTASGTHVALFQITAFGSMLAENVQSHNLADAVDRTFSGDYPCEMCKCIAMAATEDSEEKDTPKTISHALDLKFVACKLLQINPPDYEPTPWSETSSSHANQPRDSFRGPPKLAV